MVHFIRAKHAMQVGEVCGIIGGKQVKRDTYFALPATMDGWPGVAVPGKMLFPCQNTGGINLRHIKHSSTPSCTLVQGDFGGGLITVASLMTISAVSIGQFLTVNHDTDFVTCGCGMCAKSICENCHVSAMLLPCPFCKRAFYCSHKCCAVSVPMHRNICANHCANMIAPGKLVLSQFI